MTGTCLADLIPPPLSLLTLSLFTIQALQSQNNPPTYHHHSFPTSNYCNNNNNNPRHQNSTPQTFLAPSLPHMLLLSCELLAANRLEICNAGYARGRRRACPAHPVPRVEPGQYATTHYYGSQNEMLLGRRCKSTYRAPGARSITSRCRWERSRSGYGNLKRKLQSSERNLLPVAPSSPVS